MSSGSKHVAAVFQLDFPDLCTLDKVMGEILQVRERVGEEKTGCFVSREGPFVRR